MDTPRDPWLQEQIERYRAGTAASASFYQQVAQLLSAQQLLAASSASRHRRLRLLGRLLRTTFRRLHRRGRQASSQPPAVFEGVVIPASPETDQSGQTVIVIGIGQQTKGGK